MARQSRPILLTRPADRSDQFITDLRAFVGADAVVIASPLLAIRFLRPAIPPGAYAGLIFTSQSGVEGYLNLGRTQRPPAGRAWCVGARTALAARDAGFDARAAGGDAAALCRHIMTQGGSGPLLHLRGQDTRGEVAQTLTQAGIPTAEAVVYAQDPQPLNGTALALLSGSIPVIAPIFSPRTAEIMHAERDRLALPAPLWFAALSPAVAEALPLRRGDRIAISVSPDSAALIAVIGGLLQASA